MSRDINDSEIRVNIRSGPEETKTERVNTHRYVGNDVMGYAPLEFIYTSSIFGHVPYLHGLMDDIESEDLKRNESVKIDIAMRKCSVSDISKECSVCLEKIRDGDKLGTINCMHTFHYSCILEWGKYKQECPLCRSRIPILEV
jgi:hypothetical protein